MDDLKQILEIIEFDKNSIYHIIFIYLIKNKMKFVFLLILSFTIDSTVCVSVNVSNKCSCNEITTK